MSVSRPDVSPVAPSKRGWPAALVWLAPLLILFATLAVAALSGERLRGDRIAAVFPPWWSGDRVLAAALAVAPVSGVGRFSFIVAASGPASETAARLVSAGALLTLDGSRFRFCLAP
jgi:hypothetical protein